MKSCPQCERTYSDSEANCEADGSVLRQVPILPSDKGHREPSIDAVTLECPVCGGKVRSQELACNFCGARVDWDLRATKYAEPRFHSRSAFEVPRSPRDSLAKALKFQASAIFRPIGTLADSFLPMIGYKTEARGSNTQDSSPKTNDNAREATDVRQLWLAAETAFSKLSSETTLRFFDWLLPFARFDRLVDRKALASIYSLFAITDLGPHNRQKLTMSLFRSEPLPEPQGKLELGGRFLRLYLILNSLEIIGSDPSEKAHRLLTRLASDEKFSDNGIIGSLKKLKRYSSPAAAEIAEELIARMENSPYPWLAVPSSLLGATARVIAKQGDQDQGLVLVDLNNLRLQVLAELLEHQYYLDAAHLGKKGDDSIARLHSRFLDFLRQDAEAFSSVLSTTNSDDRAIRENAGQLLLELLKAGSGAVAKSY
jgi:hypothetical protein